MKKKDMNECIKEEGSVLAGKLVEDVSLSAYDLRRTYWQFRVTGFEGKTPAHRILTSYYDDQIYIPPADRKPGKVLHVFDMGEAEKPARYAIASCSVRLTKEDEPVSLFDLLKRAHRRNLVGFTEEAAEAEALAIAKHVLGYN